MVEVLVLHVPEIDMAPAQILDAVRRTPFEPFRLVLATGKVHNIRHPDQCMVMSKSVVVGEVMANADGFIEWTVTINPWNVLRIEYEHELAAV
jgi:hypothetical protein